MLVIGSRARSQPPPPFVVFEALTQPHRDPHRPWLILLDDEHEPTIIDVVRPERVVWGSIWTRHPDAVIEFDLSARGGSIDYVRPPAPSPAAIGHLRKRMNELINANLRYTFGQYVIHLQSAS